MNELVFVDTNVLLYARDDRFPEKQDAAGRWLADLFSRDLAVISPQVIGEFCNAALKKAMLPDAVIRQSIEDLAPWCFGQVDVELITVSWTLRARTKFQWWDCLILASAIEAGCGYLLSDDMDHRRVIDGVTIINPFRVSPAEILQPH